MYFEIMITLFFANGEIHERYRYREPFTTREECVQALSIYSQGIAYSINNRMQSGGNYLLDCNKTVEI